MLRGFTRGREKHNHILCSREIESVLQGMSEDGDKENNGREIRKEEKPEREELERLRDSLQAVIMEAWISGLLDEKQKEKLRLSWEKFHEWWTEYRR